MSNKFTIIMNKLSITKVLLSLAISISVGNCMNGKTESQVMLSSIWQSIMPKNAQTLTQYPVNSTPNSQTTGINNNYIFKQINNTRNNSNINWANINLLDIFNNTNNNQSNNLIKNNQHNTNNLLNQNNNLIFNINNIKLSNNNIKLLGNKTNLETKKRKN